MPNVAKLLTAVEDVAVDEHGNLIGLFGPNHHVSGQAIVEDVTVGFTVDERHANLMVPVNSETDVEILIPNDSDGFLPVGFNFSVYRKGTGGVTFVADDEVVINSPSGLSARSNHSVIAIVKLTGNTWLAAGDLG